MFLESVFSSKNNDIIVNKVYCLDFHIPTLLCPCSVLDDLYRISCGSYNFPNSHKSIAICNNNMNLWKMMPNTYDVYPNFFVTS